MIYCDVVYCGMGVVTRFTALTTQMHSTRSVLHFTFRIPQFHILLTPFHHGILEPPIKKIYVIASSYWCFQIFIFSSDHYRLEFPLTGCSSLAVDSVLLNSASSNRCWSSWHSGGNGWSAPIAGYLTKEPKNVYNDVVWGLVTIQSNPMWCDGRRKSSLHGFQLMLLFVKN